MTARSEPVSGKPRARCAIYARVSTEKQKEQKISIPDQVARCRVYAELKGWDVIDVFIEAGSGRDAARRPKFREMIAESLKQHRPYDFILVHSTSRFYRDQAHSELVRRDLKRNRVQVRSLTQDVEDDGGAGSLALSVMGLIDEYQSREGAKHVRRALEENARQQFRNGGVTPYGYRLYVAEMRGQRPKHRLEENPDESGVVREVFARYLRGIGIKNITTQLNAEGLRTRRNCKWTVGVIGRMLSNETYVGRNYFKGTDPVTEETRPRDEWIVIECPPLIDEAAFQQVQEQLASRRATEMPPHFTTSDVLLSKIGHCGACDKHLHIYTGKKNGVTHRYYRCAGALRNGVCEGGDPASISEALLNEIVLDALCEQLLTADRIEAIVAEVCKKRSSSRDEVARYLGQLNKQRAALTRREKNLWDLAASEGLQAISGFKSKVEEIQEEKENLNRNIAAQEHLLEETVKPISRAKAKAVSEKMKELLGSAETELLRRFVHALVGRVEVTREEVRIIGQNLTVAQAANDSDILADMPEERVRTFDREWRTQEDSNL